MNYDDIHMSHRDAILKQHASFLRDKAFVEFGVCRGVSMLMWHDLYTKNNLPINFIGFDSFQGLPEETEDKNTIWHSGQFSTDGSINPSLCKDDIKLVVGFYNTTLNADNATLLGNTKIGIVHIDCDMYSSTKTIWEWLLKYDLLANGAIIIYDDWGAYIQAGCEEYDVGEAKAHKEIENTHGIVFRDVGKYIVDPSFYEVKVYTYENRR